MIDKHGTSQRDHSAGALSNGSVESAVEIVGIANLKRLEIDSQDFCCGLCVPELKLPGCVGRIPKDSHAIDTRNGLLEKFKPFPAKLCERGQAGYVTAGPRQARH
jgi:hypothetical protein